ncbi:uncharacterized protein DS421_12g368730 [Arachis hypogaea]|nr:uncharacterized protein DS421_12g368730 [Arachis hypogaea]
MVRSLNSSYDQHSRYNPQYRRADLRNFDGSDALGWIFSMNQYFEFFMVPEEEQIGVAAIHMSGRAITWFQMSQRTTQLRSRTQLKREIEIKLRLLFESLGELLFNL